ncbi:MAG: DUF2207 family protein [Acidimicrobiia bacterium]
MRGLLLVLAGTTSSSSEEGFSTPFSVAAGIAGLVWLAVIGLVVLARRPPRVRPGPETQELPPEPPAVAGLLCDDFTPGPEAGPATLVDLSARRQLTIEEVQPGRTLLRIRRGASAGELAPFERRIFGEVQERALDGVVPAEALTTGTGKVSKSWHRALAKEVVADSQARGLTVDRWSRRLITFVAAFVVVPAALLFIGSQVGGGEDDIVSLAAFVSAILVLGAGFAIIVVLLRSLAQLPTPAGCDAAAFAMGLRDHLRQSPTFPDAPPASVQLWGRHLAYAAAMGIAQATVDTLPFGAEDDNWAWSRFGGRWRRVHVRYPRALPPGWGKHPAFAAFLGVVWGAAAIFVIYWLVQVAGADLDDPTIDRSVTDWVGRGALIAAIPFALLVGWALWVLVRTVPDFWTNRTVVGEIVRARSRQQVFKAGDEPKYWYYLGVDDGTGTRITAWRVRSQIYGLHAQGETVTAVIAPNLGYVREMRPAEKPAPSVG